MKRKKLNYYKVYYKGEMIGEWVTNIINTKDQMRIENHFKPYQPIEYVEIEMNFKTEGECNDQEEKDSKGSG